MNDMIRSGDHLDLLRLGDGLIEIRLDRKQDSVNKLDDAFSAELAQALQQIRGEPGLRGVLLSSGKDAFLAGADIASFVAMFDQSESALVEFSTRTSSVLTQLEELPVPVVTAINGYALGGGLEAALCSDYRVLAANAQVGLPETGLGILPGVGGTVRLPRLIDAALALEWIVSGRAQKAEAALKAGVVDAVAEPDRLRETALQWLARAAGGELDWPSRRAQRRAPVALNPNAIEEARAKAQRTARHYPAALVVVNLLEQAANLPRDTALRLEAEAFARLAKTPTAKALIGIFLANQQIRKKTKALAGKGRPVQQAAVLGAGIMGGGIAYATASNGIPVVLKDIAQSALDLGVGEARKLSAKQVEIGRMKPEKAQAIMAAIRPTLDFGEFGQVDIVIEAIVEILPIKQEVLGTVESLARTGTVLASNTSSLAIADIASPLQRAEDVVGMHFFNPVPVMPLVEVVRGPKTRDEAIATAVGYAVAIGKTPLVVKDCAGFLVNRLLGAYLVANLRLIHEGADFAQIDRVMETWGMPMGPAYLNDVVGMDTLDKVMAILGKAYPEVMGMGFEHAFSAMVREKRYGQKNGAGFFRYDADVKGKPKRSPDPLAYELLKTVQPQGTRDFSDQEILDRHMLAMILEGGRCLEEQVVDNAAELDAGMRLGSGFPAHHGGPLFFADHLGLSEVLARAERYAPIGGLYRAGQGVRKLAAAGLGFYGPAH